MTAFTFQVLAVTAVLGVLSLGYLLALARAPKPLAEPPASNPWDLITGILPENSDEPVISLPIAEASYSLQKQASPHEVGFWVMVNGVMIPKTLVSDLVASGYGELVANPMTCRECIVGRLSDLKMWLPAEVFNAHP